MATNTKPLSAKLRAFIRDAEKENIEYFIFEAIQEYIINTESQTKNLSKEYPTYFNSINNFIQLFKKHFKTR